MVDLSIYNSGVLRWTQKGHEPPLKNKKGKNLLALDFQYEYEWMNMNAVDKSAEIMRCNHVYMGQKLKGIFLMTCRGKKEKRKSILPSIIV